jgi:trehalose/maltose transport system permease protein
MMTEAARTVEGVQVERRAGAPPKPKTGGLRASQTRLAWILLLPSLAIVAFIAIWPLIQTIYQSFTNSQLTGTSPTKVVGLKNYTDLLNDVAFRNAVGTTIKFTVVTVVFEFILGMIIALVVNSNFRGRGLTRTAMLIPWAIITVVSAQMWKWMFNDTYGVINDLLYNKIGIPGKPIAWLADPAFNFYTVAAVDIWKTTPFVALLLLAGLQVIPGDVYEAATVDGASKLRQFIAITLPLLRPAILVTLIFRSLDALRVFDVFYVMLGQSGSAQSMAIYDQQNIVSFGNLGYGAAISVAIFLIIAVFVATYTTVFKVEEA